MTNHRQCPKCKSADIVPLNYSCLRCDATFSAFNGEYTHLIVYMIVTIEIYQKAKEHALKIGNYYFEPDLTLRNDLARHKQLRSEIITLNIASNEKLDDLERMLDLIVSNPSSEKDMNNE